MANETHHDHAIEHRDARQGDEAHTGGNGEWQAAEPKAKNSSDPGKRDRRDDHEHIAQAVEAHVKQNKDQSQSNRDDKREAEPGPLKILELAAPLQMIAARW